MVEMTLVKQAPKTRRRRKKNASAEDGTDEDEDETPLAKRRKTTATGGSSASTATGKGKEKGIRKALLTENDINVELELSGDDGEEANLSYMYVDNPPSSRKQPAAVPRRNTNARPGQGNDEESGGDYETIAADVIEDTSEEDSDEVTYDWSTSLRQAPVARRKRPSTRVNASAGVKGSLRGNGRGKVKTKVSGDEDEVLDLSSD
jgi:hypothetical protein